MHIRKLKFQNFRSFGKKIVDLELENLNFFLGRNNTGKTNILKLFRELKDKYIPNPPYFKSLKKQNWFNLDVEGNPLKMSFVVDIDEPELYSIIDFLFWDPIKDAFEVNEENKIILKRYRILLNELFPVETIEFGFNFENQEMTFEYLKFRNFVFYSIPEGNFIEIWDNSDIITKDFLRDEEGFYRTLQRLQEFPDPTFKNIDQDWASFFSSLILSTLKEVPLYIDLIEDKINYVSNKEAAFRISRNLPHEVIGALLDKVKLVSENRIYWGDQSQSNLQKEKISNLLYALSQGDERDVEKYNEILDKFQSVYANLTLSFKFIKDDSGTPHLVFYQRNTNNKKEKYYDRNDSAGSGIIEMLFFLYSLIGQENTFLFIDGPELQLHPHSQRLLYSFIKEYSTYHQIVIITHSIYFFMPDDLENIFIFSFDTETTIKRLSKNIPRRQLRRIQRNFTVNNREAIFADGIVFVEGPSEEFTFPLFFKMLGLDLNLNNLSLINIGGKGNFPAFLRMAKELGKAYWFFFDEDALGHKAGQIIDKEVFMKSIIRKNKEVFAKDVRNQITRIEETEYTSAVEFQSDFELLRIMLERYNFFIFDSDFEDIFEYPIQRRVRFTGGKVEKALQLMNYIRDREDAMILPEGFQKYVELIRDDLRKSKSYL